MTDQELKAQSLSATLTPAIDFDQLRETFRGEIILPQDQSYEASRHIHNVLIDKHPTVIVRPLDAGDVSSAVRFATNAELEIAVRGGAHNYAGFGSIDGGILIDLSAMNAVVIDPEARVGYAQGGAKAGAFVSAALAHGLVTPFGDTGSVGIGGLTLGGGVGWLTRKLGMTIDSLLAAEMVLADGSKVRTSETEHPDLFWAIRGGGGNFGIVTSFEFRLHPIGTVLGGSLILPPTREVIRGVIDLARQAPDELTTISMLMRVPPMPDMPAALHGQLALMVTLVWMGDLEAGQRALEPFRQLAAPLVDAIHPMPFGAMYEANQAPDHYAATARAFMAEDLDDAAIDAMLTYLQTDHLPAQDTMAVVQFRVLGGAMGRVPVEATAFPHRQSEVLVTLGTVWFGETNVAAQRQWVEQSFAAMRHVSTGAYLNFLEAEGEGRVREAYPDATYKRLAQVKRRYDPQNVFHHNQNVRPAEA